MAITFAPSRTGGEATPSRSSANSAASAPPNIDRRVPAKSAIPSSRREPGRFLRSPVILSPALLFLPLSPGDRPLHGLLVPAAVLVRLEDEPRHLDRSPLVVQRHHQEVGRIRVGL